MIITTSRAVLQQMTAIVTIFGMVFWLAVYAVVLMLLTPLNLASSAVGGRE